MTSMFGNLPPHEKQAFFSILDEYFESRPHLLSSQDGESQEAPLSSTYTQPVSPPAPAPRRANPPPAPAARKPVSPMPSATSRTGPSLPSGIVSGKSFGSMNTSSAGAAFGSLLKSNQNSKNPITPGEAVSGLHAMTSAANRMNLNQQRRTPAPPPQPPAPSPPAQSASIGQAEVIYDYNGSDADDLNVRKFDIINLLEKVDENWWKAEATDGSQRSGLVPSSYTRQL